MKDMEKYMGYRARETIKPNEEGRQLPVFEIAGTDFIVDIQRHEFRQADNPHNRIIMNGVKEEMGFSHFLYDTQTRNIHLGNPAGEQIPEHVRLIIVPPLKDLDPVGLARRQGLPDQYYGGRAIKEEPAKLTEFKKETKQSKPTVKNGAKNKRKRSKKHSF
jgi:hypothetical protein